MVKRGGTKRKIEFFEKIENKGSRRVTCTKRRDGLFSKASQLCLLSSPSQMAVLTRPPSSDSYVSFHSFGHSSIDAVVSAFLSGNPPPPLLEDSKEMREDVAVCLARKDLGLGFWWENESPKNPQEISDRIASIKTLLANIRHLRAHERTVDVQTIDNDQEEDTETTNSDVFLHHTNQDQTLIHQSNSAIYCIPHVLPESFNEIPLEPHQALNLKSNTEEEDQISAICESFSVY